MPIVSQPFLLIFLPLSLLGYWGLTGHPRARLAWLALASYAFYALHDARWLPLLLFLSFATWWLARSGRPGLGVVLHLVVLAAFKASVAGLVLPLGLSFYAFKHIGYLLDCRSGATTPGRDFLAFATHSAFFPQIVAGPIDTFSSAGKVLAHLPERLGADLALRGFVFLTLGLAKKLLVADPLAGALQAGLFEPAGAGLLWAWASLALYALQLYFDFAGYTDIVLGVAQLFGMTLPANFNAPYLAGNPRQFWDRWHMSLSLWFRVYVFLPLSRSLLRRWGRAGSERAQQVSNLVTMTLVGLWHGATAPFLLWGAYHGLLLDLHAWFDRRRLLRLPGFVAHALLLIAVLFGWALFLSPDLRFAGSLVSHLTGGHGIGALPRLAECYGAVTPVVLAALALTAADLVEADKVPRPRSWTFAAATGLLAALCLLRANAAVVQFAYAQF